MADLTTVRVRIQTGDVSGAGTNGAVYLGICGREFRADRTGNDFTKGSDREYRFGIAANVREPDRNDPRDPQLAFEDVDRFPVYIRFDQRLASAWNLRGAQLFLNGGVTQAYEFRTQPSGVWLGNHSGAFVHLLRHTPSTDAPAVAFVFKPGGVQGANVFTRWTDLVTALSSVSGLKILEFDDSREPEIAPALLPAPTPGFLPEFQEIVIPTGLWDMTEVAWTARAPRRGRVRTSVRIPDGCQFTNLRVISGQLRIVNDATIAPVADFFGDDKTPDIVHLGQRGDDANPRFVNRGVGPFFAVPAGQVAVFVLHRTLFGPADQEDPQGRPLLGLAVGAEAQLQLLQFSAVGDDAIDAPEGSKLIISPISSGTRFGRQATVTGTFEINVRAQSRKRLNPLSGSAEAAMTAAHNDLVRATGSAGPVTLPSVKPPGFYTGGISVKVVETAGENGLTVLPAVGDSINGVVNAAIEVPRNAAREFTSDGETGWIITGGFG